MGTPLTDDVLQQQWSRKAKELHPRENLTYEQQNIVSTGDIFLVVTLILKLFHGGLNTTSSLRGIYPVVYVITLLYLNRPLRLRLRAITHRTKRERNTEIRGRYQAREPLSRLADVFGISEQGVNQILHSKRK
jgi:hypothetical protein